jgi:hypothetical protein
MGRKRKTETDVLPKLPEPERDGREAQHQEQERARDPEVDGDHEQPKIAEAIRQALTALGVDTPTVYVGAWIKERYTLTLPRGFPSAVSSQRKKLRSEQAARSDEQPTVKELMRVKELAETFGGVTRMAARVAEVELVAAEVHGVDRLHQCLDALRRLSV